MFDKKKTFFWHAYVKMLFLQSLSIWIDFFKAAPSSRTSWVDRTRIKIWLIQGVPQNMTVARPYESCFWTLNLLETFSRQPTFTCIIFLINIRDILRVLVFPKCGLPFLCCLYYRRYEEFRSDFNFIKLNQIWTTFFHIFGNIKRTKKVDHIFEMPKIGVFC